MSWGRLPIVLGLCVMVVILLMFYCYSRFCRCKFNHDIADNYISDDDFDDFECPE
jgi:hypothetical protein